MFPQTAELPQPNPAHFCQTRLRRVNAKSTLGHCVERVLHDRYGLNRGTTNTDRFQFALLAFSLLFLRLNHPLPNAISIHVTNWTVAVSRYYAIANFHKDARDF